MAIDVTIRMEERVRTTNSNPSKQKHSALAKSISFCSILPLRQSIAHRLSGDYSLNPKRYQQANLSQIPARILLMIADLRLASKWHACEADICQAFCMGVCERSD